MKIKMLLIFVAVLFLPFRSFALDPTTMGSPSDLSTGVPMQPTFTWTNTNGAWKYKCQICTDVYMTKLFTELLDISSTKASVKLEPNTGWTSSKISLEANKPYYWRMVAYDVNNNTVSSPAFKFTTGNFGPVTLASPANNGKDVAVQPAFSWGSNAGTSKYKVQVCADQYFTTAVVDVSKTDSGNDITGTSYQMSSKTLPNTVLEISKSYYWRIIGYDQSSNVATSAANKFTVITPTFPDYPIKTAAQISSVYGPRNVANSTNWFHGAIDVASEGAQTINVVAPCNCKVVFKQTIENADLVDFVNTEPSGNPKSFRIQHVAIPSNLDVGSTFKRGEVIFTTLQQYQGNGYHVHLNAWDNVLAANDKGSEKGDAENRAAVNPLKYWKYTSSIIANSNVGPSSTGTWPRDPDVGNLRYFYFTITCPRTDFTLNKIVVAVTDANGTAITQNFLANPAAATLDFSVASSVSFDKNVIGTTQTWGAPVSASGAVGMPISNGVRIHCPNFDNGSNVQKVYNFRYYIRDDAPNPKYFQAQLYDCNGSTGPMRYAAITNDLPATPVNQTVPKPPTTISVAQITNGLKVAWSNIPSNNPPYDYWAVYRKKAGSTESPSFIGITTQVSFQDRTDIVTNTIVPGTNYSYSVAGVNRIGQGANSSWANGTMTSIPNEFVFQNRTVATSESDLKAKNSITIKDVDIWGPGAKNFIAGSVINIYEIVNVANGAAVNFSIDPAVK